MVPSFEKLFVFSLVVQDMNKKPNHEVMNHYLQLLQTGVLHMETSLRTGMAEEGYTPLP